MNLLRKIYGLCTAMLCLVLIAGCSDDDVISSNGTAGYLKLMVAPQTSTATRAGGLSLSNVRKVEVSMLYGDLPVTQSLNLSSAEGAAELGLESEKLELRAGVYKMQSYKFFEICCANRSLLSSLHSSSPRGRRPRASGSC